MELTEPIENINQQLIDHFGIDTVTGQAMWRVAWSEDQFEKRYGTYDDFTPAGLYIRTVTEVRLAPKYRQWICEKYVLERLTIVPDVNLGDLPTNKTSYEPLYVFEDRHGNYLPPRFDACKFVIDTIYAATGKQSLAKYKDPEDSQEASLELKRQRVESLVEELFGDQSALDYTTVTGESIIVPRNFQGNLVKGD
jgi:hypothetical protein